MHYATKGLINERQSSALEKGKEKGERKRENQKEKF
jgi:hypothetical protein